MHICRLHRRVNKIQESRRCAIPIPDPPNCCIVLGINGGDRMNCCSCRGSDSDAACVDLKFLLVYSKGVSAGENIVYGPSVTAGRICCSPVLGIVIGQAHNVCIAGFSIGNSYTQGISSLGGGYPAVDLERWKLLASSLRYLYQFCGNMRNSSPQGRQTSSSLHYGRKDRWRERHHP